MKRIKLVSKNEQRRLKVSKQLDKFKRQLKLRKEKSDKNNDQNNCRGTGEQSRLIFWEATNPTIDYCYD